ncbi:uncharacterized protein VP01_7829g1, partial [Puccinia sorghi]
EAGDNPPVGKPLASPRGGYRIITVHSFSTVRFIQPSKYPDNITVPVMDVETQWNSTLQMFQHKMIRKETLHNNTIEKSNEIEDKIARYLQQDVEPKETEILPYCAPSERVSSKGRNITTWDRVSLEPQTVQELICVKQWYQHFGSAFFLKKYDFLSSSYYFCFFFVFSLCYISLHPFIFPFFIYFLLHIHLLKSYMVDCW